jgi:hypothetical protein
MNDVAVGKYFNLEITQQDIDKAKSKDAFNCVISTAFKRQNKYAFTQYYGEDQMRITVRKNSGEDRAKIYIAGSAAHELALNFDKDKSLVVPTTLELKRIE